MSLRPVGYKKRLIDEKIDIYLKLFGAISIEGPKWCGKTWTSLAHSKGMISLMDKDFKDRALIAPESVFMEKYPQLIDEWIEVPEIWDAVRNECDKLGMQKGNFILTCSTKPSDEIRSRIFHSGAGRVARLQMRTMSLYETGDSSGKVSLKDLYEGEQKIVRGKEATLEDLSYYIVRGGWPSNLGVERKYASLLAKSYIATSLYDDISREKERSINKMIFLVRSLARNESTPANNSTLERDIIDSDGANTMLARNTIDDYLDILTRLQIIENQPAFSINYRSSTRIGKTAIRRFTDPSLACAALDLAPDSLLSDLRFFGLLFESLVVHDLRVYAETLDAKVFHFRDRESGDEVDAIIEFGNGNYAAIEIKLGENSLEIANKSLMRFYERINKKPKFMAVIVGVGGAAYRIPESGIWVVPINMLKN